MGAGTSPNRGDEDLSALRDLAAALVTRQVTVAYDGGALRVGETKHPVIVRAVDGRFFVSGLYVGGTGDLDDAAGVLHAILRIVTGEASTLPS